MQHRGVDPGLLHLGQRIVDVVGRDLPVMRRHLAVFPDVDLRVDDQHGVPPRISLLSLRAQRSNLPPPWPSTEGDCFVAALLAMTIPLMPSCYSHDRKPVFCISRDRAYLPANGDRSAASCGLDSSAAPRRSAPSRAPS